MTLDLVRGARNASETPTYTAVHLTIGGAPAESAGLTDTGWIVLKPLEGESFTFDSTWSALVEELSPLLEPSVTIAKSPISPGDEAAYRGEWVILHRGAVVAHAPTAEPLLADDRVSSIDYSLYRVPKTRRRFR